MIIFIPLQEGNEESKKRRKVDEDEKINEVEVKGNDIIMIKSNLLIKNVIVHEICHEISRGNSNDKIN